MGKQMFIQRPENWDTMTPAEKREWALSVVRGMGVPAAPQGKPDPAPGE